MRHFKDLFSGHSADYQTFRPSYPAELFHHLASLAPAKKVAWDAGCGNGQASLGLAQHFDLVYATDASEPQLKSAVAHPHVRYSQARAEQSGLPSGTVNLTISAQAYHWFQHEAFVKEIERLSTPQAVVSIWCYDLCTVSSDVDGILLKLYDDILGKYWEPERKLVDEKYASVIMPFEPILMPEFEMKVEWSLEQLVGYIHTWSALKSYMNVNDHDPVDLVVKELQSQFGAKPRSIYWKLSPKAWRLP